MTPGTENGCKFSYEERPSGGKNLKPVRPEDGPCVPLVSPLYIVNSWLKHQQTLKRLVLNLSGMNVDKKIRFDVENLFLEVLNEKFDGISRAELEDIKVFSILLAKTFPEELENANKKYNRSKPVAYKYNVVILTRPDGYIKEKNKLTELWNLSEKSKKNDIVMQVFTKLKQPQLIYLMELFTVGVLKKK